MAIFSRLVTVEGVFARQRFTVDAEDEAAADAQITEAADRMARKRTADETCAIAKGEAGWQAAYLAAQAAAEVATPVLEAVA